MSVPPLCPFLHYVRSSIAMGRANNESFWPSVDDDNDMEGPGSNNEDDMAGGQAAEEGDDFDLGTLLRTPEAGRAN